MCTLCGIFVCCVSQQAHIPKAVMMILEKDPQAEQQKEQERLAAQEKLYQVRPS